MNTSGDNKWEIICLVCLIVLFFGVGVGVGSLITPTINDNYYPDGFIVAEVNKDSDIVTIRSSTGFLYQFQGVEDWMVGDGAAAIMDSRGTSSIIDDVIIRVIYTGYNQIN